MAAAPRVTPDLTTAKRITHGRPSILGKPLAGQRVTDILSIVRGLRSRAELARRRVLLAARGVLTVPALFAAALEPAIDGLYLADGLISFRSIVETEVYKYPFGNFVPNLLAHTDLPELTASAGAAASDAGGSGGRRRQSVAGRGGPGGVRVGGEYSSLAEARMESIRYSLGLIVAPEVEL